VRWTTGEVLHVIIIGIFNRESELEDAGACVPKQGVHEARSEEWRVARSLKTLTLRSPVGDEICGEHFASYDALPRRCLGMKK
jgi:hypothetical protein